MPYQSQAQVAFMHQKHPQIAARWDKEYQAQKGLPEHKRDAYARAAAKVESQR